MGRLIANTKGRLARVMYYVTAIQRQSSEQMKRRAQVKAVRRLLTFLLLPRRHGLLERMSASVVKAFLRIQHPWKKTTKRNRKQQPLCVKRHQFSEQFKKTFHPESSRKEIHSCVKTMRRNRSCLLNPRRLKIKTKMNENSIMKKHRALRINSKVKYFALLIDNYRIGAV